MSKRKPLRYFYLEVGDHGLCLHKKLQINLGRDTIVTWCYPLEKRVAYTYSMVKRNKQPAFDTREVAAMMGRGPLALERAIMRGDVEPPQYVYSLTESRRKMKYMWSEADIMRTHEYFCSVHFGRPRKDGMITSYRMPTAREVRAMIHQEATPLYVQNDKGEFVPTWKAQDFS